VKGEATTSLKTSLSLSVAALLQLCCSSQAQASVRCAPHRSDGRLSVRAMPEAHRESHSRPSDGETLKHLVPPREGTVRRPKRAACGRNSDAEALVATCRPASPTRPDSAPDRSGSGFECAKQPQGATLCVIPCRMAYAACLPGNICLVGLVLAAVRGVSLSLCPAYTSLTVFRLADDVVLPLLAACETRAERMHLARL
jgi:hypothetical protein